MRHVATVAVLALGVGALGQAEVSALRSGQYEVGEGAVVERCGGIVWQCEDVGLGGYLWLEVDAEARTGRILENGLELQFPPPADPPSMPFPTDDDLLRLEALVGTLREDGSLELVSPAGSDQTVLWTLRPSEAGLTLNGDYDEGCCDRFVYTFTDVALEPGSASMPGDPVLRLHDGRFEVTLAWEDAGGTTGIGRVAGTDPDDITSAVTSGDSGLLWFFSAANWEMLVKVLDGCALNGHYWVFAASATNVGYVLTVEDTSTDQVRTYTNPVGTAAPALTDTAAFASCP